MDLLDFINNNKFKKIPYENGNVFGFISKNCWFSKQACKILREKKIQVDLYDVNEHQFVINEDPLRLNGVEDNRYLDAYNNMKNSGKGGNWAYPHLFFYKNGWHYIGGKSDLAPKLNF